MNKNRMRYPEQLRKERMETILEAIKAEGECDFLKTSAVFAFKFGVRDKIIGEYLRLMSRAGFIELKEDTTQRPTKMLIYPINQEIEKVEKAPKINIDLKNINIKSKAKKDSPKSLEAEDELTKIFEANNPERRFEK